MSINKLKIESQIVQITILQIAPINATINHLKQGRSLQELQGQIANLQNKQSQLKLQFEKQCEINFILKGYFGKIEKIIYSKQSHLFEENPIDYQKIELHIREILRRLNDINNSKLNSTPVVYRKDNVKIYRHTFEKTHTQK